ncbi:hypothetical protein BU15DRAFT_74714 [Melanogaster broomeanus]|nr:hypothetical protein BU15DRAFT_74714 [Melanogaster broomeanus]
MSARGRKPNPSASPSRARIRTQQRQHRARKAQLVRDLEDRCRTLEEENAQLRQELDSLAGRSGPLLSRRPSGSTDSAASDVMRSLADAAASMTRWQQAVGMRSPAQDENAVRSDANPAPPASPVAIAISHHPQDTPHTPPPPADVSSACTDCARCAKQPRLELAPPQPLASPPSTFHSLPLAPTARTLCEQRK